MGARTYPAAQAVGANDHRRRHGSLAERVALREDGEHRGVGARCVGAHACVHGMVREVLQRVSELQRVGWQCVCEYAPQFGPAQAQRGLRLVGIMSAGARLRQGLPAQVAQRDSCDHVTGSYDRIRHLGVDAPQRSERGCRERDACVRHFGSASRLVHHRVVAVAAQRQRCSHARDAGADDSHAAARRWRRRAGASCCQDSAA